MAMVWDALNFSPRYDAPDRPSDRFFFVVSGLSLGLGPTELAAQRKPAGPVLFGVWVSPLLVLSRPSLSFCGAPMCVFVVFGKGLRSTGWPSRRPYCVCVACLRSVFRAGPGGLPLNRHMLCPRVTCRSQGPLGAGGLMCIHQPRPSLFPVLPPFLAPRGLGTCCTFFVAVTSLAELFIFPILRRIRGPLSLEAGPLLQDTPFA